MTTDVFLWMAESAVRTVLVAAVAGLALAAGRVRSAALRSAAWTAVLFAAMLMPFCLLWRVPVYAPAPAPDFVLPDLADFATAAPASTWNWLDGVAFVYTLVAGVLLFRLAVGWWMGRRLGTALPEIGAAVRESGRVDVPATFGIVRPFIVLPLGWREWEPAKREAVLLHERAHVERGDFAVQALASVHAALFWFSPLAWWLKRHLAALAEQAADERALSQFPDRAYYAGVVLSFLGRRRVAGVAMARESVTGARIDRILNATGLPRVLSLKASLGIAAVASAVLYVAAAVSFAQAPPPPPAPPAPPEPPARRNDSSVQVEDTGIHFRRSGKRYVITDKATVDQANGLYSSMKFLGEQQRALGEQQRALGEKMREVSVRPPDLEAEVDKIRAAVKELRAKAGVRQEEIGQLQHMIGELQHRIGGLQHLAGAEQSKLGAEMSKLGAQQAALGAKQAEAARKANEALKALLDQALKDGRAKEDR